MPPAARASRAAASSPDAGDERDGAAGQTPAATGSQTGMSRSEEVNMTGEHPKRHVGTFAEGEETLPEDTHVRTFAEGEETLPHERD